MRITVCELPQDAVALTSAWRALCDHVSRQASDLVLLPEFSMVEAVWLDEQFDIGRWQAAESRGEEWLQRLAELGAARVVGTRPVTSEGRRFNEGYLWSAANGVVPLRRKYFMPNEPKSWEARWYDRGDANFPAFCSGAVTFGLNVCTELWAVETLASYAARGVQVILSPRATSPATVEKWLAAGIVAAVRSGAYCVSSNRVDSAGDCGGVGWVIGPDGHVLARTSAAAPFATVAVDLEAVAAARRTYPRYVFNGAA